VRALARHLLPAVAAAAAFPGLAAAQTLMFPPTTSRDFNIDLFEQPALGSPQYIAMAGAIAAVAQGAAGLYTNPASAAVRPETHIDKFAWGVYLNSYIPADGQDSNNNGQTVTSYHRSLLGAAGILLQYGPWGLTLDGGYTAHEISPQEGGGLGVRSLIGHLAVARTFMDESLSAGIGLRLGGLNVFTVDGSNQLFTQAGLSGEAGVVWLPKYQRFRLAFSGGLPIHTGELQFKNCDPNDCYGYMLPLDAIVPWVATLGGAYQFSHSPWNQRLNETFRDERTLIIAIDLSFTGAVENGYGLEAFAAKQLQQSGRSTTVTPRLGLESELLPGWLRLRAGTYLEPSRFPETDARWHLTGGFEVRVVAFHLLGQERRVQISAAADVATRYQNVGFSIGFWN